MSSHVVTAFALFVPYFLRFFVNISTLVNLSAFISQDLILLISRELIFFNLSICKTSPQNMFYTHDKFRSFFFSDERQPKNDSFLLFSPLRTLSFFFFPTPNLYFFFPSFPSKSTREQIKESANPNKRKKKKKVIEIKTEHKHFPSISELLKKYKEGGDLEKQLPSAAGLQIKSDPGANSFVLHFVVCMRCY